MYNFSVRVVAIMQLLLFSSFLFSQPEDALSYTINVDEVEEDWREVSFEDDGKKVTIKDYEGKVLLVKFWAPWCNYCRKQMPVTSLVAKQFKSYKDFELLPISIDYRGESAVERFYKEVHIKNLPIVTDEQGNLFRSLGLNGIPVFLLISKEGDILKRYDGVNKLDIDYIKKAILN